MPIFPSNSGPTADQVRAHRDRIVSSKVFALSRRQIAFLENIVDAALEGRTDQLKEFTLAIEVFGRDKNFDPRMDSIVRVEASRLRAKLREYYSDEGRNELVRIDIPKGHYIPNFSLAEIPKSKRGISHAGYRWAGLVLAVFVIAYIYSAYRAPQQKAVPMATNQLMPSPSTVAVLPLRDLSRVPEEYFAAAITDSLISSLAQTQALRVTSFTSIMRYKNTEIPIPEIGRELGVAYIVEGSVIRYAEQVRINIQLIDTNTDKHVWTNTFDRPLPILISVQSEVAAAIASQISDELLPSSQAQAGVMNQAAHEAYMKGRYFYNQFTAEGFRRSMKFFQEAIDIEPDYAEAYAGLASCHCLLAGHGLELVSPIDAIPEAHSLAMKALSLNSQLAEPTAFLGIINFKFGWDPVGAEKMLGQAIELNPSLYQAYLWHSQVLESLGRHDDAISRARFAKQLNPLSLAAGLNLGWQLFQAEKYIEADAEIDKLIDFEPNFWGGHWLKAHIYNQHGAYENAIKELRLTLTLGGGHSLPKASMGYTYAIAGMADDARQVIVELEALSKDTYVSPFHIATIYAGLNESDMMFEWLERAYQVRARSLAWLHVTREMKPYHDDIRFQGLLERIGIYSGLAE